LTTRIKMIAGFLTLEMAHLSRIENSEYYFIEDFQFQISILSAGIQLS